MARNMSKLLFIGRKQDADQAWRIVRQIWPPGKALRASQAYAGMGLLHKHNHLRLVVVGVDQLSEAEMSFFSTASRRYPKLRLLAFGKGDQLSNSRLADATWRGATEAVSSQQLSSKLSQLRQQSPQAAVKTPRPVAKEPVPVVQQPKPAQPENFLAPRTVTENRRKAPAVKDPKINQAPKDEQFKTEELVTPEELRVLLGEDGD